MTKNSFKNGLNSLQKSILTLVLAACSGLIALEAQNALDLANAGIQDLDAFGNKTPLELLCLQEFDQCEQEFKLVMGLIPKEDMTLKQQLIQARVTTMYTIARSSAIHYAASGEVNKALALLKGLYAKLHEYANVADWDRLIMQASPVLQDLVKS